MSTTRVESELAACEAALGSEACEFIRVSLATAILRQDDEVEDDEVPSDEQGPEDKAPPPPSATLKPGQLVNCEGFGEIAQGTVREIDAYGRVVR